MNPALGGKPLIVCGDPKARHGIVLAKNEEAKKYGIKTAETVYSALKKCPNLQLVSAHMSEYQRYSGLVKEIYARYTEKIEEYSIDECSMDMTESTFLFGDGVAIAENIRKAVQEELGLTVSVGVSFNKVFAKLASELKKPNAVTEISRENYQEKVFPLPVRELLFVGEATERVLSEIGVHNIGDLARADENLVIKKLGKRGKQLCVYARGQDDEPVKWEKSKEDLKSIGNSFTLPKDITNLEEVKRCFYALSESVTARQRDAQVGRANTVHIVVRNEYLRDLTWQTKIPPTALCGDIAKFAYDLFCKNYPLGAKVRMLGITISGFDYDVRQLTFDQLVESQAYDKKERAENAVASIRKKYGYDTLQRGVVMSGNISTLKKSKKDE